jgi:hypothetical protein
VAAATVTTATKADADVKAVPEAAFSRLSLAGIDTVPPSTAVATVFVTTGAEMALAETEVPPTTMSIVSVEDASVVSMLAAWVWTVSGA